MSSYQKTDSHLVRLNKFLSMAGVTSRRNADIFIEEGKVSVNGKVVKSLGIKIDPDKDNVVVGGKQVVLLHDHLYVLLNKPHDAITTMNDERGRSTIMDYVKLKERVFPVGRLDRNTTGVLLLTNDGELANGLMHPRHEVPKAYKVTLDKSLAQHDALQLSKGIRLPDGQTAPAQVHKISGGKNKVVGIVIHEGRNRQVHRMFESLGYVVEKLDRVAYADMTYEGLKRGQWRFLSKGEVRKLKEIAGIEGEDELFEDRTRGKKK